MINFLNFIRVVRRYKMAMILNILGLSIAFAAFIIIMVQLDYDSGFDKFHEDSDKIFRVEILEKTIAKAVINRPLAEQFFGSSAHIVAGTLTSINEFESFFYVEQDAERIYYKENSFVVTPEFFDVFTFDFVEGKMDGTKEVQIAPKSIFIPLSMSRKIFGNESAIGKQIVHSTWGDQTVVAVYRDLPPNSVIKNCIYYAMQDYENKQSWNNYYYHAYIRVNQPSAASMLIENFKRTSDTQKYFGRDFDWNKSEFDLRLTALPDIHYTTDVQYDQTVKANKSTLLILFAIAIVIVVIAAINFTNFSTALTPMRIRSINTQRIFGAELHTIRVSLVLETVFVCLFSYLISIFFVLLFRISPLAVFIDADLSLTAHPLITGGTALVAIFTGLLAGAYPAHYMTSFAPALVMKGSFGLSPKGKRLRNTLVGMQFVSSFTLIIGVFFMYLQNHHGFSCTFMPPNSTMKW